MSCLDGKIIIITGGTQGIGEGIAKYAAECGAAGLVICGRNEQNGNSIAQEISQQGCPTIFVRADLADVKDCHRIVAACEERFGLVHGLVNAAANTVRGTLENTSVELWDYQFAVNVRAPFVITQQVVRIMKEQNIHGSIVNILSLASYCGLPVICAYSSTKGALSTFTKNIANALRYDRIRVNGLNIGWTDTPQEHDVQVAMGQPENWKEIAEPQLPHKRMIKVDDVARLCVFYLSDESGIVTGSLVDYDQKVVGSVINPLGK